MTNEEIEQLINIAYYANNHARRLANKYEPNNKLYNSKINDRAEWLAKHCADKTSLKIVQS